MALPELGIYKIKAKIDTGARTSALHTYYVQTLDQDGRLHVCFGLHPTQRRQDIAIDCCWPILDRRQVTDSGGHREWRYTICTELAIAAYRYPIELTLTNREHMGFRMLIGRTALRGRFQVDPARSFVHDLPALH